MSRLGFVFFSLFHCSFSFPQARMERDMSARKIYGEEETPEGAAGSEFGKKQREEARRKKFGIVTREFKVEDQPWILKVNGKAGKRWVERLPLSYSPKVLVMQDKIMYYKSYYLEKSRWLDVCKECFFFFFKVQRYKEGWRYRKCILLHLHAVSRWSFRGFSCSRLVQLYTTGQTPNSDCWGGWGGVGQVKGKGRGWFGIKSDEEKWVLKK